jgi:DNA-binding response OmpR family regulator
VRILYVDDEAMIGRAVSIWLTRRGHEVVVAESALGGQQRLEEQEADAIFIDLHLGQDSGLELHAWIEDHDPRLAERVVFVTGEVFPGEGTSRALRMLGRRVLTKPFELKELDRIAGEVHAANRAD